MNRDALPPDANGFRSGPDEGTWPQPEMQQSPRRIAWSYVALGAGVTLVVLAIVAIVLVSRFRDPTPELTIDALHAAQRRWQAHGPASYDLELTLGGATPGRVQVKVRDGEATDMVRNGERPEDRRSWNVWTVPGQFAMMARELELAADPQREMNAPAGTRLLLRAQFDPELGYPVHYHRMVVGQAPEVEWTISVFTAFELHERPASE